MRLWIALLGVTPLWQFLHDLWGSYMETFSTARHDPTVVLDLSASLHQAHCRCRLRIREESRQPVRQR